MKNIFLIKPQASAYFSKHFLPRHSHVILINHAANMKGITCIAPLSIKYCWNGTFAFGCCVCLSPTIFFYFVTSKSRPSHHIRKKSKRKQIGWKIGRHNFDNIRDVSWKLKVIRMRERWWAEGKSWNRPL